MLRHHFRAYLTIFLWCAVATVCLHASMLFKPHTEGDELVYYVLSQRMGWDLSNYTTQDDPRVNNFPYTIYHKPLFHHPPLLPLVLKIGSHFTANPLLSLPRVATPPPKPGTLSEIVPAPAVATAFLFSVFVCVAALWYAWRLMVLLEMEPAYGAAALVGITLCPLILFSTVRIHHDGLMGLMLLCGLVAFAQSLQSRRILPAVEPAVWLVAAMNIRFNALAALPLIVALPFYVRISQSSPSPVDSRKKTKQAMIAPLEEPSRPVWVPSAIVLGAVFTLGMQHFYRLLTVYGTLWPDSIIQPIGDVAKFSPFLAMVERVDRPWICWELAAIFPLAILFVAPWNVRAYWQDLRERRWSAAFVVLAGFMLLTNLGLNYKQVRYFAAVTPLMHVCWPYLLRNQPRRNWATWCVGGLGAVTLLLMITTGFINATLANPDKAAIVPSLAYYWPPLLRAYIQR